MRSFLTISLTLFAISTITFQAHSKELGHSTLDNTREKMLSSSKKTTGSDIETGVVVAIVDSRPAELYKTLTDYNQYHKFLPFITKSNIISRGPKNSKVKIKAKILKGVVTVRATVLAKSQDRDTEKIINVKLVDGDLKRLDISFKITRTDDDKSILSSSFMIDPGLWYVKDSTLSAYNKINARRTVRSIRAHLKEKKA